jgi:hypothetical protein
MPNDRRGGASLRPNQLHHRCSRPAATTNEVFDESGVGQDARRLESVKHPAYTCTNAMTSGFMVVWTWGDRTQVETFVGQRMSRGDGRRCKRRSSSARALPGSSLFISATRRVSSITSR